MADSKETRMERISRHLFNLLADIAEEAFRDGQTLTPEALMERLEESGFLFLGNGERIAMQLVSAALRMAFSLDDGTLSEALASSFTDSWGWPLLVRREGGAE